MGAAWNVREYGDQDRLLLSINNLTTELRAGDSLVRAVDGVSLTVLPGETVGIVGESGCGKSMTALSVMRLVPKAVGRIVGGSINFAGKDLLAMGEKEMRHIRGAAIAMIFQDPMVSLNPTLSVGSQVEEPLRLHLGLSRRAARERTLELFEHVGIPDPLRRMREFPHQFSGGMRQRVMIAMALSCRPRLVLADEPTTALDVTIQAQILELLTSLGHELNTAYILITHDLGVIAGMTKRAYVMYAGRIVESASTSDLFSNPRMPYTWGLLSAVPRFDEQRQQRLVPIDGQPPDLAERMTGCRFAPRCRFARAVCTEREPPLAHPPGSAPTHEVRCWATQAGGWLSASHWLAAVHGASAVDHKASQPMSPG